MEVARVDPSGVDAGAIGFRLAPRINAAGRLHRADAGLELLLTVRRRAGARDRRGARRASTSSGATSRRGSCSRPRRRSPRRAPAARARGVRARRRRLAPGRDRHRRLADRRAPPPARGADRARRRARAPARAARSRPSTCSAGSTRARAHLLRHGGHRAAAGLTIARGRVDAFRAAFVGARRRDADARRTSSRVQRVDAVVPGDALQLGARRGARAPRPVRDGQPASRRCSCRARCSTIRGRWGRAATSRSRSRRAAPARAACPFGRGSALPAAPGEPVDAAVRLEVNRYNGAVEPRLVLRHAQPARPAPIALVGELGPLAAAIRAELALRPRPPGATTARDGRAAARGPRRARRRHRRPARRPRRRAARPCSPSPPTPAPARGRAAATASAASRSRPGRRSRPTPALAAPVTRTSSPSTRPPHAHLRALAERAARRRAGPTSPGARPSASSRARVLAWELDLRAAARRALPRAARRRRRARAGEPLLATLRGTARAAALRRADRPAAARPRPSSTWSP